MAPLGKPQKRLLVAAGVAGAVVLAATFVVASWLSYADDAPLRPRPGAGQPTLRAGTDFDRTLSPGSEDDEAEDIEALEPAEDQRPIIYGIVFGPDGEPAPRVDVYLYPSRAQQQGLNPCYATDGEGVSLFESICDASVAQIVARLDKGDLVAEPLAHTVSDGEGSYRFDAREGETYVVYAERRGQTAVFDDATVPLEADLSLSDNIAIGGEVVDEAGRPVPRARVAVVATVPLSVRVAEAGPDGRFTVTGLPDTSVVAVVRAAGYLPAVADAVNGTENEVVLATPRRVLGVVLANGRPAGGARITLSPAELVTTSGPDGRFAFDSTSCDSCWVDGRLDNLFGWADASFVSAAESVEVTVELALRARLSLRVTAGASTAAEETSVTALPAGDSPAFQTFEAKAVAENLFVLDDLPAGPYQVSVHAPGWLESGFNVTLAPGEDAVRTVTLVEGVSIVGRVTDSSGQPVEGVELDALPAPPASSGNAVDVSLASSHSTARSDETGAFALEGLRPGKYVLSCSSLTFEPATQLVVAPSPGVVVALRKAASITGKILAQDGTPVAGALVGARERVPEGDAAENRGGVALPHGLVGVGTQAGPEGTYELAPLKPGSYVVEVYCEGLLPSSRELQVEAGHRHELDFRLDAGASISGVVVDDAGRPLDEAQVSAVQRGTDDAAFSQTTVTDATGRFRVAGLHRAEAELQAAREGFAPGSASTVKPGSDVRLVLAREGQIHGRLVRENGRPVTRFELDGEAFSSATGEFTHSSSNLGNVEFVASGDFAPAVFRANVVSGRVTEVGEVRVGPGAVVLVQVKTRSGALPTECQVLSTSSRPGAVPESTEDGSLSFEGLGVAMAPAQSNDRFVLRNASRGAILVRADCSEGSGEVHVDTSRGDSSVTIFVEPEAPASVAVAHGEGVAAEPAHDVLDVGTSADSPTP